MITDEQMRAMLLEYFKAQKDGFEFGQQMEEGIRAIAVCRGLHPAEPTVPFPSQPRWQSPGQVQYLSRYNRLEGDGWAQLVDVVWQLIGEGILRPGNADGANGLPHLSPTRYGQQVISETISPYDPDGYFTRLNEKVPDADGIILTYLRESVHTFRVRCILSSAVCLGCASERAFDVMLEAYGATLSEADEKRFLSKIEGKQIKTRYDEFMKEYEANVKNTIDRGLRSSLGSYLSGLFQVIRNQRNDAGHPTGETIEREQVYATITAFPAQLEMMYRLIGHFLANKRS